MKTIRLLCATLLSLAAWSNAPAEPKPLPWLVAQQGRTLAKCELDGRMVPSGTRLCSEGKFIECSPNGSWQRTGKDC
jgi:hypothetical protein